MLSSTAVHIIWTISCGFFLHGVVNCQSLWEPGSTLLRPGSGDHFGWSVSVSADGSVAIVGDHGDDTLGSAAGAAFVFERDTADQDFNWTLSQTLYPTSGGSGPQFGFFVGLNGDGSVAVVGAIRDRTLGPATGAAYVFERNASSANWTLSQTLYPFDGIGSSNFGWSLSTDESGDVVVVGAPDINAGAAYVFERSASGANWTLSQTLHPTNSAGGPRFGYSVAMDYDGSVILVGTPEDNTEGSNAGAAYVFERNASSANWTLSQTLYPNSSAGDLFGTSASSSQDGSVLLIGAPGAAYVFERNTSGGQDSNWTLSQMLHPTSDTGISLFGNSVSLNSDGSVVLVGAPNDGRKLDFAGAVYMFERNTSGAQGSNWVLSQTLYPTDGGGQFGWSATTSEDASVAVIGAFSDEKAYVVKQSVLEGPNPVTENFFLRAGENTFNDSYLGGGTKWPSYEFYDYDGDGRLDVLIVGLFTSPSEDAAFLYKQNEEGLFLDVSNTAFPQGRPLYSSGIEATISWGDFDNNGRADFLVAGQSEALPNQTLRTQVFWQNNLEQFYQLNVPEYDTFPEGPIPGSISAQWVHINGDDLLDICLTFLRVDGSDNDMIKLYLQTSDHQFFDNTTDLFEGGMPPQFPNLLEQEVIRAEWADFDSDGRMDFILHGSRLWMFKQNASGIFTDVTGEIIHPTSAGFFDNSKVFLRSAMAWADVNNDTKLDFFLMGRISGRIPESYLYIQNDTGHFVDQADEYFAGGSLLKLVSGSVSLIDYDGDGLVDLFLSGFSDNVNDQRVALYRHSPLGTYTLVYGNGFANIDLFPQGGPPSADDTIVRWADVDGNGLLDFGYGERSLDSGRFGIYLQGCPVAQGFNGIQCVPCAFNEAGGLDGYCLACNETQIISSDQRSCDTCPGDQIADDTYTTCVCPEPLEFLSTSSNACEPCSTVQIYTAGLRGCEDCPSGTVPDINKTACEQCQSGFIAEGGSCVFCSSGITNTDQSECIETQGSSAHKLSALLLMVLAG